MGRTKLVRSARKKGSHTPESMKTAVYMHLQGGMSIRKAAKEFKIPYPTLRRYVIKCLNDDCAVMEPNYSVNKVFTDQQEKSLKEYIIECANKFFGLSTKECRRLAFQMAKINNILCPETWKENGMAGKDWFRGFKRRHPDLSVRKPEACSIARASAFNPINVQSFFDNLYEVCQRFPQFGDGTRVYNLDETSTTTVQKPGKVLAQKGQNVGKVTSGERGTLVTTCLIVNATGNTIPPVMVFPRKKFVAHMTHGAPAGTLGLTNQTGWMNSELFVDVIKHFVKFTASSKENPSLLIMDNHESHLSIEALDLAKKSGVTVLTLHPHTTNKLQPLDVGLNGPFKVYYNSSVDSWMLRNSGRPFSIYNVAECVGEAFMKTMTPINIINAFKKCGIFPFNRDIFTEIDFLPSSVTDRPQPPVPNPTKEDDDATSLSNDSDIDDSNQKVDLPSSPSLLPSSENDIGPRPLLSFCLEAISSATTKDTSEHENDSSLAILASKEQEIEADIKVKKAAEPSHSNSKHELQLTVNRSEKKIENFVKSMSAIKRSGPSSENFISPKKFRPDLKAAPRKIRQVKRRAGKSIIATDNPEKTALAEWKKSKKTKPAAVKTVTKDLFKQKNIKKKPSRKIEHHVVESSDEDDEEFQPSGSSSGGDFVISDSDDEEIVLRDDFPPLKPKSSRK